MKTPLKFAVGIGLMTLTWSDSQAQEPDLTIPTQNAQQSLAADRQLEEIRRTIADGTQSDPDMGTEGTSDYGGSSEGTYGGGGMSMDYSSPGYGSSDPVQGGYSGMGGPTPFAESSALQLNRQKVDNIRQLLRSDAVAPAQKSALYEKLKVALDEYFLADMTERVRKFDRVKSQVMAMESKLKNRLARRDEIVDFQLKQILFSSEGLDTSLPATARQPNYGYGRGMVSSMGGYGTASSTDGRPALTKDEVYKQVGYDVRFGLTGALRTDWHTLDTRDPLSGYFKVSGVELARSDSTENSLKSILLAFHNFYEIFHHLPSSSNRLVEHQPPHSWRVAILPLLGHVDLYREYNFDEAWDSEHNLEIAKKMPDVYRRKERKKGEKITDHTSFLMLVGNGAFDSGDRPTDFGTVTDGVRNTIAVVTSDRDVVWTQPEDFQYSPTGELPKLAPSRLVGMADGSVRKLRELTEADAAKFHAMITQAGGEVVNDPLE